MSVPPLPAAEATLTAFAFNIHDSFPIESWLTSSCPFSFSVPAFSRAAVLAGALSAT